VCSTVLRLQGVVFAAGLVLAVPGCRLADQAWSRLDGSPVRVAAVEQRIPQILEAARLPGLQVAVVADGRIVYSRGFGVRDAGTGEPVGERTVFGAMSFSKTLFAYLVLQLVDEGRLDLDAPLVSYLGRPLPEYEAYGELAGDLRYERLTARMVLTHTTGFPNWRAATDSGELGFVFEPGARFSYSGEGFQLLQLVVEEITGEDLESLARARIFEPFEMERTSFVWQTAFDDDSAVGHDDYGHPTGRNEPDRAGAAGSARTTAADYARFLLAVMEGRGLSPEARQAVFSPQVRIEHVRMFGPLANTPLSPERERNAGWGLGWGVVDTEYGRAFFHTGREDGAANYHVGYPDRGLAVVLLGNAVRLEAAAPALTELLIGDHGSPFGFLGYEPYESPRNRFVEIVSADGLDAGLRYYASVDDVGVGLWFTDELGFFDAAGRDLLGLERFEAAGELYAWLTREHPDWPHGWERLAQSLTRRDDYRAAVDVYRSGLEHVAADSPHRGDLAWRLEWARAVAAPRELPDSLLRDYVGTYGPRHVDLRDGALVYYREGAVTAEPRRLCAMTDDTFVLPGVDFVRLQFVRGEGGKVDRVRGLYLDGQQDETPRAAD